MKFTLLTKNQDSRARLGKIETAHGTIDTPIFMPVGTRGSVKSLLHNQLKEIGSQIILGNTYHLMLRPGIEIIRQAGGLHQFIGWDRPILTDSGGFQVFSLASLNAVEDEGVHFQSHIDGSKHFLGPKESMEIQKGLGSDIVMAFDECSPYPCERQRAEEAMERTHRWAKICRDYPLQKHQSLFGIVQGSTYPDLRRESAEKLRSIDFDGYAIGGLSVGEPAPLMYEMIDKTEPHLPESKPRYLMGVGTPRNIIEAVMRGIDMFDCVMPTRNARNGTAYTWSGKVIIKAGRYANDFSPLDSNLNCYASQFSKAYIRHLLNVDEISGLTLVSMQNLAFYIDFLKKIRQAIAEGTLRELYTRIAEVYPENA
ncbi:MAG: tRNA guanosine(34) transglycosylase Tgt [Chlamydiales bacterium]